jgi:WD40 repeat protein
VAGSTSGQVRVYDPEAGAVLHRLEGLYRRITDVACTASSSVEPHHPRLVSASYDRTAKVWDGETGEWLADLRGWHRETVQSVVAVWKEHTEGHDRIATADPDGSRVTVWDGETFTPMHMLDIGWCERLLAFRSAEGPVRLLMGLATDPGGQIWDPEEGRLLHDGINQGCPLSHWHVFESAQGRHLLAIAGSDSRHPRHPGDTERSFLDVWDLGEAPAQVVHVRPAHKHG